VIKDHQFAFQTFNNTINPTQQGAGALAGFGTVPEPASAALLGIAMVSICQLRHTRNRFSA
jgi:hypothetical protein